ncbi:nef protein [Simian immunodeficiency virus]|uniref:Protein Nef n=1 Tax=Simian immunodeficiency virus TaxID=11723 RepID=A0A0D4CHT5_SIV|nr:nef protein [Simian immunodeficiency virus]
MGNAWKKSSLVGWPAVRDRIHQTTPEIDPAPGVGKISRELAKEKAIPSKYNSRNNEALAFLEAHEDEEVGFPVKPQVPLRPMTFKGAFDLSFFLNEKGGLDGLVYSPERAEILDLWVYHTQGFFPDWQNYTPGPGVRWPLTFGWMFKLVPVSEAEAEYMGNKDERAKLLHPACTYGFSDPHKEILVWKYDRSLGTQHVALMKHPELFIKD